MAGGSTGLHEDHATDPGGVTVPFRTTCEL